MWQSGWRDQDWSDLDQEWDIIIIGGGITGAGILREAAQMGLRAVLFESRDFASGTSSRSSKLVHGGFRYLRNGQVKLTYQAVRERERLLKEGRGLISPLGCLLANYHNDSIPAWIFGAGLILYDLLALNWGHRHYDSYDMQALCPGLCDDGLEGGYRFFDAQTDDARLVLRLIQEAREDGALAFNYAPVISLIRRGGRKGETSSLPGSPVIASAICGVQVYDATVDSGGGTKDVFGNTVINATGVWADDVRSLLGGRPRLRRLRGSHLIFSRQRLPVQRSVNVLHPKDHRPVFAYPWEGVTIVGTTDVDHDKVMESDPQISQDEIDYLMQFVDKTFPAQSLTRADIQAVFSGYRPVINTGKANPSKESREHALWFEDGMLTITGGKLTTFRLMAREALNAIFKHSSRKKVNQPSMQILNPVRQESGSAVEIAPTLRARLFGRYGNAANQILDTLLPNGFDTIGESIATYAELRWAARNEAVQHLDDLLLRRIRLGLLLPEGGQSMMSQIRKIVQSELGWSDHTWQIEQDRYLAMWKRSYSVN